MSHFTCCGCWPAFVRGVQGTTKTGRTYRRAKYNEREYSIEFENLIEEEDFYTPSQHIVTDVERDLLSRGKFGELLQHENDISRQQDAKLKEKEENARLEDEAYIQAKKEASRVAKQAMRKQANDKSKFPNMQKFDSVEFSKWLSEEKIDITSPELDVEDFESFLEKVRAKSAQALEEAGKKKDATVFEQTLTQGLAATKIAGDALNALQPVELHAVGMPSFNHTSQRVFNLTEHDVSFGSNSVGTPPTQQSQLIDEHAVKIKSDSSVIQTSQLPGIPASPVVDPTIALQEPKDRLIDISPVANAAVTFNMPVTHSSQPSVAQSVIAPSASDGTPIPHASKSQLIDISDTSNISRRLVTFSSEISETHDLNPKTIDVQPVTQSHEISVKHSSDNSLPNTPQFSLNSTPQPSRMNTLLPQVTMETNEKLIDISPLKDDSLPSKPSMTGNAQFTLSFENQSFDEPSLLNQKNPVEGLPNMHVPQPASNQATPASKPMEASTISSDIQLENEHSNSASVSSKIVPMATVVTINTPRNVATNLKPVENNRIDTLPTLTNGIEVQSFKMVKPAGKELNSEMLEDSLNDDDDFNDFDDDFVSSNSNATFEDYLT